jgi:hypothetical protein
MEPIVTNDGFKVVQNPEESRKLLGAYYESQGFHVITREKVGDHAVKQGTERQTDAGSATQR